MAITLDDTNLFDSQNFELQFGSLKRDQIQRGIAGLDGQVSIDLGKRERKIIQTGSIKAVSRAKLDESIGSISAFLDGQSHTLVTADGREFANLRMDVFEASKERTTGTGFCCDYKIEYTQLAD